MHYSPAQYSAMRLFYTEQLKTEQLKLSYTLFTKFPTVVPNPAEMAVTVVAAGSIVAVGPAARVETEMAAEMAAATAAALAAGSNSASVETGMAAAGAVAAIAAVTIAGPNLAAFVMAAVEAADPIVALAGPTAVPSVAAVERSAEH
jgi:hypothetical protein